MRATLNNYDSLSKGKISLGDNPLTAFKNSKAIQASVENKEIPSDLKPITNIRKISFGHFQLLEKIITSGLEYNKLLKIIAPYILRPVNEYILDNENEKTEKEHVEKVNNLDIGIVINAFEIYLKTRDTFLYKDYNGVIYAAKEKEEDKIEEDDDVVTTTDTSETARSLYEKKFFWHNLTKFIAGDFWHEQEALDSLMGKVIIYLAEDRNRQIVENLEHKASLNK